MKKTIFDDIDNLEKEAVLFGLQWETKAQIMAQIRNECLEIEEHLEANDKKREKSKKKYYWGQHYELRNVNNSKRLPLNAQDKEFKDMA